MGTLTSGPALSLYWMAARATLSVAVPATITVAVEITELSAGLETVNWGGMSSAWVRWRTAIPMLLAASLAVTVMVLGPKARVTGKPKEPLEAVAGKFWPALVETVRRVMGPALSETVPVTIT